MSDDDTLLLNYAQHRSNEAFAELVRRHINLVYFAALRQTGGDVHRAEDATQETFARLASKASQLHNHPQLAGWLHTAACHCARNLIRTEHRRAIREQTMNAENVTSPSVDDHVWLQVRPIIDDALQELPPSDREAVLLRFFENLPFAEIGTSLKLSENAARMRVTRALEILERALARRGVTSTGAALATALTIPAALAVPAGLSQQISSAVLGSAAAAGAGGGTIFGILKIMTSIKSIASIAALAAIIAAGTAAQQHRLLAKTRAENVALQQRESDLAASLRDLATRLEVEKKRAEEADRDNEKLLTAAADLQRIRSAVTEPEAEAPLTTRSVNARFQHGKDLAGSGQYAEALKEFLWCYDTGMQRVASLTGVRASFLLSSIAQLGKNYPPALDALKQRRDKMEARMIEDSTDNSALMDIGSLNAALGENAKTLKLFDSMAPSDGRRYYVLYHISDLLLEARRYSDITSANSYSKMAMHFDTVSSSSQKKLNAALRPSVVENTSKNIEALAGAGDLPHAGDLMTKLLAFDNSSETRESINRHLVRAGHPELQKP